MDIASAESILTFKDISVNAKRKTILYSITGAVKSGQLLAVMGPTGCGKTTLLNVLTGRHRMNSGFILLNGEVFNKAHRRRLGYVSQDDVFLPNLTVRETLYFTAMVCLPDSVSKQEKNKKIDDILSLMDLKKCQNTVIGDIMTRGLSGGERKRTNIACELLISPDFIFLDEPTSGLDSSTSTDLMYVLKKYAQDYNKTVITTIHQPSSEIFNMFSLLLLLVDGYTAYFGYAHKALEHFLTLGVECRTQYNPANSLLEILRKDSKTVKNNAESIIRTGKGWPCFEELEMHMERGHLYQINKDKKSENGDLRLEIAPYENKGYERDHNDISDTFAVKKDLYCRRFSSDDLFIPDASTLPPRWPSSLLTQIRMLIWRSNKQAKGHILNKYYIAQSIIVAVVLSLVYFQRSISITALRDRMGLVTFVLVYWAIEVMNITLTAVPGQRAVLRKERAAGMYRLLAYYLSSTIIELPVLTIVPVLFFTLVFWLSNLGNVDSYFLCMGVIFLHCLIAQSIGHVIGSMIWDLKLSICISLMINMVGILLAGFYAINLPQWFRWGKYLSQSHYPLGALMIHFVYKMNPIFCNQTSILDFPKCSNGSNTVLTHEDILIRYGIDLPIYCYLSSMIVLLIAFRVMGYYVLRFKR